MPLRLPVIAATLALLAQAALAQVAVPPDPAASAAPARVTGWRHSNGETTRIVLDLDGPAPFRLELARGLARVRLPGAVSPALYRSFGGEVVYRARVYQDEGGAVLEAEVSWRAGASAFLLREPDRVVLDVAVPAEAPPPPGLAPDGITFETALASTDAGPARNLHLARVDPARFQPRVL
ncbi:MAG TPA: hypothetical protein VNT60_03780, partial [Deinococcales bacterium]|nr:hypothetical protein [Deinococcales bacterium]